MDETYQQFTQLLQPFMDCEDYESLQNLSAVFQVIQNFVGIKIKELKEVKKEFIRPKQPVQRETDEQFARRLMKEEEEKQRPALKKAHSEIDEASKKLIAQLQEMEIMQM